MMTLGKRKFQWHRLPKAYEMIERLYGTLEWNESLYRDRYRRHNEEVMAHFSSRPADLLVIDLTQGDGFDEICAFLDLSVPDQAFPHKNRLEPLWIIRIREVLRRWKKRGPEVERRS